MPGVHYHPDPDRAGGENGVAIHQAAKEMRHEHFPVAMQEREKRGGPGDRYPKQGTPARSSTVRRDVDEEPRAQTSGRVLVAEDDPVCMRLLTAVVEKEGYAVPGPHSATRTRAAPEVYPTLQQAALA